MSEYSSFILVNIITFRPYIFGRYHRMSGNSGVGMHKFHYKSISEFLNGCIHGVPLSAVALNTQIYKHSLYFTCNVVSYICNLTFLSIKH